LTLDANGRRSGVTEKQYDPVSQTTKETRIDWLYDNLGRLTREIYDLDPTTSSDDDFVTDYVLDLVGNRLAKSVDQLGSAGLDDTVLARCSSGIHRAGFVREFLTYVSPLQFRC